MFARQLDSVQRTGAPGSYVAELSDIWNCPTVPHGGLVTATALRAIETELDLPEQSLRSATNVFASQVQPGPAEIDVTILRRGRSISQATATVRNPGEEAGHMVVAVYGIDRIGFEFTDVTMPEVPQPAECPSFRDPPPEGFERRVHMNFWDQIDGRPALGNAPWDDTVRTSSDCAAWHRFDEPPMLDDGRLDPLALVTLCDTMPGSVGQRMGRIDTPWAPPSCDLTVHLLGDARSEWVLAHNRARRCTDGYASLEIYLWEPSGELVAYGTQMMYMLFPEGPPAAADRRPRP